MNVNVIRSLLLLISTSSLYPMLPIVVDKEALNKKLVSAVKMQNIPWITTLIEQGADVNYNLTITHGAAQSSVLRSALTSAQDPEVIRLLLARGARAQSDGSGNLVDALIARGYAIFFPSDPAASRGQFALTQQQFLMMLRYMLEAGAQYTPSIFNYMPQMRPLVESVKFKIR